MDRRDFLAALGITVSFRALPKLRPAQASVADLLDRIKTRPMETARMFYVPAFDADGTVTHLPVRLP